jgi:predicted dehydrogenase
MNAPETPLRVGLIGYGLAGSAFHAPLIATTPGLRLDSVVTANPDRRAQLAREHPSAQAVDSIEQLLDGAADLDLVVVASPNDTHSPAARAALEAGLPVVVDKPLAATAADVRDLIALAEARGLLLTVFQNRRWDSDFLTAQHLITHGALGTVHRYESRFERWRPEIKPGWRESADPAKAGGILNDLGSHLVDQALHLFGPATHVYAEVDTLRPAAATDDDAFIALAHATGVHSHLWMSALTANLGPRLRILGNRAAYTVQNLDPQEAALRAGQLPGPGWGAPPESDWGKLGTPEEPRPYPSIPGNYPAFYTGVAATLREGAPAPVDPHDALATLTILELARRSAAERRVVKVPALDESVA